MIDYTSLEFDKNGGLTGIDFKVDCQDGSAKAMPLPRDEKFGFFRDYSEGVDAVFGTGGHD